MFMPHQIRPITCQHGFISYDEYFDADTSCAPPPTLPLPPCRAAKLRASLAGYSTMDIHVSWRSKSTPEVPSHMIQKRKPLP